MAIIATPSLVPLREAADQLSVARATLHGWVSRKKVTAIKVEGQWYFTDNQMALLRQYVDTNRRNPEYQKMVTRVRSIAPHTRPGTVNATAVLNDAPDIETPVLSLGPQPPADYWGATNDTLRQIANEVQRIADSNQIAAGLERIAEILMELTARIEWVCATPPKAETPDVKAERKPKSGWTAADKH